MRDVSRRFASSVSAVALALVLAAPATGAGVGNGAPRGTHYNLNIHGMENAKNPTMTGNDGHSIFVPLVSTKTDVFSKPNFNQNGTGVQTQIVDSKIWLVPGDTFQVCDGNGFDRAIGCDDTYLGDWSTTTFDGNGAEVPVVSERIGAVFQLPCNTNLNGMFWDSD